MRRGEIWLVALDPTVGSEIQKTRPCLVVSPDVMIKGLRTVIVATLTSGGRQTTFRLPITFKGVPGMIVLDQLRTVDKTRLLRRLGNPDDKLLADALAMLRWIFSE